MTTVLATSQIDKKLERAVLEKCSMLVKKVQDKKTAEIFEHNHDKMSFDEVIDILELSEQQAKISDNTEKEQVIISILSTMKSLAHSQQSKTRWAQFTKEKQMSEEVYEFSSKGDFTNRSQIVNQLTNPKPPLHIVTCTHTVRIDDILKIAYEMEEKNTELKRPRILRIYLDEADKYMEWMREKINDLVKLTCVQSVVLVTATPAKIWSIRPEWKHIFVLNPRILDTDNSYLTFKDCHHINIDGLKLIDTSPIEYVDFEKPEDRGLIEVHNKVLQHFNKSHQSFPLILHPGNVIFAPGCMRRKSHECVGQFWNYHGCVVFIFNGEKEGFYGKLIMPDQSVIDVPRLRRNQLQSSEMKAHFHKEKEDTSLNAQLNEIIADFYHLYNLSSFPLVMTGLLTVERAQTLVHPVWGTFTHCIYYKARNPDDSYQQQRQLGRIRNFPTFRGIPLVFSSDEYRQDVLILEERADSFASQYHGAIATLDDYKNITGEARTSAEKKEQKRGDRKETREKIVVMDKADQAFLSITAVNTFLSEKLKYTVRIREFHKTAEGYEVTTRLQSVLKKNKAALTSDDRLTDEKFKRLNKTQNISDTSKGQRYMVYPVYRTMTSAPNEVRYFVSYLPPK
jgi:hypothetical protein